MRTSLLTAMSAAAVLAATTLSGRAPAATTSPGTEVSQAKLTVKLHVASSKVLQFHGVVMEAVPSGGDAIAYAFVFGDGKGQATYQPTVMHGYSRPGTYHARVGIVDSSGQGAVSAPVTIHVVDSIPPVVRINEPSPGQRLHLGKAGISFSGSATDPGGVRKVQLAIQLISSRRHFKTAGGCIWYDGKSWLLLSGCSSPHYFTVPYGNGRWSYQMNRKVRIPAGSYEIQVRAIDRAGNISHYYAPSLHTILPFELSR